MQQLKQSCGKLLQPMDDSAGIRQNVVDGSIQYSQSVRFQTYFIGYFKRMLRSGHIVGLPIRQDEQHFPSLFDEEKLLHDPPESRSQRRSSARPQADTGMNGLSRPEQRIDRTDIPPVVSVKGCYGHREPLDGGTGRRDGMAGRRRQFHGLAVHAGGCVQQDVEACIDGDGFRLLGEDLWVSCLDPEQFGSVEPSSC